LAAAVARALVHLQQAWRVQAQLAALLQLEAVTAARVQILQVHQTLAVPALYGLKLPMERLLARAVVAAALPTEQQAAVLVCMALVQVLVTLAVRASSSSRTPPQMQATFS
jgi:hypothetical protein